MDAQQISVVGGLIGVCVAALGLLLTWYRREERPAEKRIRRRAAERTRSRIFAGSAAGVLTFTALGVVLTVRSSTADSAPSKPRALTVIEYRGRLGKICSDAQEQYSRIEAAQPQAGGMGLEIQVEAATLEAAKRLTPPRELQVYHNDMVAVWGRRVSAIEALYRDRSSGLTQAEAESRAAEADKMATDLNTLYDHLGVPECAF